MKKIIFYFLYGVVVFLATILIANNIVSKRKMNVTRVQFPQEYMKNVNVTHFTEDGKIKDHIIAKYWGYMPKQEVSTLIEPHLKVAKPNNTYWVVDAKSGIAEHKSINSKITKLELNRDVVIMRPKTKADVQIEVTTEQLFYFPEIERVQTDKFVKLTKPGLLITGFGLLGYLDKNLVELQNDVKTSYFSEN